MKRIGAQKAVVSSLIFGMVGLSLAGCGATKDAGEASKGTPTSTSGASATTPASKKEPVTLKWYVGTANANLPTTKAILDDYKKASGNTIEIEIVPGEGDAFYKKIDVDLTSAGDVDLIPLQNPIIHAKYASNNWLLPLNDIYKETGVDYEKEFGKNLTKFAGDKIYSLPTNVGTWAVFYNKKIFDDAKVPYPKGEWTWDQYVETAKKLTDASKGIYGSTMPDYDNMLYLLAAQRGIDGYKADGSSNYDDPAFKESLQWYGDLGNKLKIQPSWLEIKSKKIPFDAFMNGKYGMEFVGTWFSFAPQDTKTYPRDWKIGITQPPVDPKGKNSIGITAGTGVNKFSKHPKEAADFVKWYAENGYKYGGGMTARVDLSKDEVDKIFGEMAAKFPAADGITTAEFSDAYLTPNQGLKPEKITGSIAAEYGKMILQEGELYLVGQKSLDDAIKSIKARADEAINKAKTAK
jgi:multiple sugar transport system substrate-binding protein